MESSKFNPTSDTAQAAVFLTGMTDIPYAKEIIQLLKLSPPSHKDAPKDISFAFIAAARIEIRQRGALAAIIEEGNKNNVDVACGFTPRSLMVAEQGYNYRGCDLPVIVEAITPVINTVMENNNLSDDIKNRIAYKVTDATSYDQLEAACEGLEGPITITCDGMLAYMPTYEQREVFSNFHKLLSKHGGVFISLDLSDSYLEYTKYANDYMLKDLMDDPISFKGIATHEEARALLTEVGFEIVDKFFIPTEENMSVLKYTPEAALPAVKASLVKQPYMVLKCK